MPELSLEERNCKNIALFNISLFLLSYFLMSAFTQSLFLYITDLKLSPHLFLSPFLPAATEPIPCPYSQLSGCQSPPAKPEMDLPWSSQELYRLQSTEQKVHLKGSISEEGKSSDELSTLFLERGQAEGHVLTNRTGTMQTRKRDISKQRLGDGA